MSAFNSLKSEITCPTCGRAGTFDIQFKYGETWQHQYMIGDRLHWGGNEVGTPGVSEVQVQGLGGPCPICGADFQQFSVIIRNDKIVAVRPVSNAEYEAMEPKGFLVVAR